MSTFPQENPTRPDQEGPGDELRQITQSLMTSGPGPRLVIALNTMALLMALPYGFLAVFLVSLFTFVSLFFLLRAWFTRAPNTADAGLLLSLLCTRRRLTRAALAAASVAQFVAIICRST